VHLLLDSRFASALLLVIPATVLSAPLGRIPPGFKPIFSARNINGWHSRTVHHGTTGSYIVDGNGVLVMKAHPFGQGGLLLSDKSYRDFELYLEANPDPNFNSGIFLRSWEQVRCWLQGGQGHKVLTFQRSKVQLPSTLER
jgi:hypothetical protein